jgi:O-succinylbenzoic acid--CoA ligase
LPFTEIRIVDEAGREPAAGASGEILVRGPTVMSEYWRDPVATDDARAGAWLRTGDFGWLDELGRLHLVGRRSDLIVSGGENVYPAEVEDRIAAHPGVKDCCVVGLEDPLWGERIVAYLVPQAAGGDLGAAVDADLRETLAGYKRPRRYCIVDELPRNAGGKVVRRALTEHR